MDPLAGAFAPAPVFADEFHLLLNNDSAILRRTDFILPWLKSQSMTITLAK
jgi:hypothetical protein